MYERDGYIAGCHGVIVVFSSVATMEGSKSSKTAFKNPRLVFEYEDGTDNLVRNTQSHKRRKRRYKAESILSLPVSSVSAFSGFTAVTSASTLKPKRSVCSLLLNGSIMFGREFCYAVEASLATPILLGIGMPVHLYSLIWVISPIVGFILQPVLGSISDR